MKIVCVGRNYAKHAAELKNDVPTEPVLFLKPDSAVLQKRNPFFIPDFSKDIHYEVELVVRINKLGKHIQEKFAHKYYREIGLGIDFTARDIQEACKKAGLPWEKAKAFDGSCVVGKFMAVKDIKNMDHISFKLEKNGELVQEGLSSDMIFGIDKLIAYISQFFTLKIGDLIFTGTPVGVGPVKAGDQLKGYLEGELNFKLNVK
jgi:2-keto-4-pentenoate hydratase/2-oxohepta-3-ene-1,7-dioic acid hydratase in catechol pathway